MKSLSHRATRQKTKFCLIPEFNNLELFRAREIHYTYSRHSHPGYAIGVIESGVGGNFYRGSTYLAPPKSVIFMNPEEVHTGYSACDRPLTYRMLYPDVDLVCQLAKDRQANEFPNFREAVVRDEALARKICQLCNVLEGSNEALQRQSIILEVFEVILSRYADLRERSLQLGKEYRLVNTVKEFLHDNYDSNVSLKQLVELTNLNRYYLIRVFRKVVGLPPYTYLNQIRIEKAKQLLAGGDAVADVALKVGMSDQSHLNRHFKRIVGITPGQYCSRQNRLSRSIL